MKANSLKKKIAHLHIIITYIIQKRILDKNCKFQQKTYLYVTEFRGNNNELLFNI